MDLSNGYIDSLAVNSTSAANAKKLAIKSFSKLCISEDRKLFFGECSGSGSKPYYCSVDFINPEKPVPRCSCPSRQIPCKHCLGLLYAYANGKAFTTGEVPEDILSKREKIEKQSESKQKKLNEIKTAHSKPTVSSNKKIAAQLEGLSLARLLLANILQNGIAGVDAAATKEFEIQAKNLGNYYISGIQSAFNEIFINIKEVNTQKKPPYDKIIESILYMSALLKKAKAHLESIKAGEARVDIESNLEAQIGHIWKLEELLYYNLYIENARLIQLSFYSYSDGSRREYVDEGFYFCLNDLKIYSAINYRPYKALKHVKEEDSRFEVIETGLYVYPGGPNPRVRWENYLAKGVGADDLKKIESSAKLNYQEAIKEVKNHFKNPLSDKNPVMLLKIFDVMLIEDENNGRHLHILDEFGTKLVLMDKGYIKIESAQLLKKFDKKLFIGNVLLVMFVNDIESGILSVKPLSLISHRGIVRLIY